MRISVKEKIIEPDDFGTELFLQIGNPNRVAEKFISIKLRSAGV